MNHTSGPWGRNIKPVSQYPTIYGGPKGNHVHIAHVLSRGLPPTESEANADLIAAAPELLQALIELKEWALAEYDLRQMPNGCVLEDILTQADKAISLATGKE